MKTKFYPLLALLITFLFTVYACQKDDGFVEPTKKITSINTNILRIVDNQAGGINIFVSVTDQNGIAIKGLTESDFDFSYVEGGVVTPVKPTGASFLPSLIITALTMDYSGSMFDDTVSIPSMETAISTFINLKNSLDQIEIIKFDDTVEVVVPLTTVDSVLLNGVTDTNFYGHGYTAFYRAVEQGQDDVWALAQTNPTYLPSVIGFTDGWNNLAPYTPDSIIYKALYNQIPVYTIGYGVLPDTVSLKMIADSTGGAFAYNPSAAGLSVLYQIVNGNLSNSVVIPLPPPPVKGKLMYRVTAKHLCPDGYFKDTDEKYFYY
jgi:hypothetical protein